MSVPLKVFPSGLSVTVWKAVKPSKSEFQTEKQKELKNFDLKNLKLKQQPHTIRRKVNQK